MWVLPRVCGSSKFQLPETLEDIRQQLEIFRDPDYGQVPACGDSNKPFLLRYDTDDITKAPIPVCLSEADLIARRLNPQMCNTKVTLGLKIEGGCSQFNFFKGESGLILSSYTDLEDKEDIVAVPMHRNVPFYFENSEDSPSFQAQKYYTEAKFLPCDLFSDLTDIKDTTMQDDLKIPETGYCDVDTIVKEKLCWSGSGAETSDTQSNLVDGTVYTRATPCDVMQHAEPRSSKYKGSVHVSPPWKSARDIVQKNAEDAELEALEQNCTRDGTTTLALLENSSWYTGYDDTTTYTGDKQNNYYESTGVSDKCANLRNDDGSCINLQGQRCLSDLEEGGCSIDNVHRYTRKGVRNCFKKTMLKRIWAGDERFKRKIVKREYTRDADNSKWEDYYTATSKTADDAGMMNACLNSDTDADCKPKCYEACKDMKYPAFSVSSTGTGHSRCRCSDYANKITCPVGQWKENSDRTSYEITPKCESASCNQKTTYPSGLSPCHFTPDYRKIKCQEACAAEDALFMTISEDGLCMCSMAKRSRTNNNPVGFVSGNVCHWSAKASRVIKDADERDVDVYNGYLGDSYVTNKPIETYQLVYSPYFGDDQSPDDGIVICEKGSATQEIYQWFNDVTGDTFMNLVSLQDIKNHYNNLE